MYDFKIICLNFFDNTVFDTLVDTIYIASVLLQIHYYSYQANRYYKEVSIIWESVLLYNIKFSKNSD